MYLRATSSFLASAICLGYAQASYLNNDLSFGHHGKISPNGRGIPNFHLLGQPYPPEILSNKVVLTPPAPGNQRGAIWSETVLRHSNFAVDVDFRATGPERGGGNLNIWYAKNGQEDIGSASIYTVGKFDGLALVIDQYAGSGGFIRGFLNDGTTDYRSHQSVDSIAFGHCEYSFRNLGRPSRIAIRQTSEEFRVDVDGDICFASSKIKIPLGYNFGISAASAENPDSFEVFKFVTTTESHTPDIQEPHKDDQQQVIAANENAARDVPQPNNPNSGDIPSFSDPPEAPASNYHSSAEQFADLHNRLQSMMKHITAMNRDTNLQQHLAIVRHEELRNMLTNVETEVTKLGEMNKKLNEIQADIIQTKNNLHNALEAHMVGLRGEVRGVHTNILGTVASMGTGLGKFVLVVLGSNGLLVVCYLLYKRRKANSPKKYL